MFLILGVAEKQSESASCEEPAPLRRRSNMETDAGRVDDQLGAGDAKGTRADKLIYSPTENCTARART